MNLIIEVPEELVLSLEGIAASRRMSIQQLALDRLRSLVTASVESRVGSAKALLRAMSEPPPLSSASVDELEAAIAAGRPPIRSGDVL